MNGLRVWDGSRGPHGGTSGSASKVVVRNRFEGRTKVEGDPPGTDPLVPESLEGGSPSLFDPPVPTGTLDSSPQPVSVSPQNDPDSPADVSE